MRSVYKVEIILKFIFKLQFSSLDSISFRPCVVLSLSLFNNISNVLDILTTSTFAPLWFPKCKIYLFWCCFLGPHLAFPSMSILLRALSLMPFRQVPHTTLLPHTWFQGPPMHGWLLINISSPYTSRSAPLRSAVPLTSPIKCGTSTSNAVCLTHAHHHSASSSVRPTLFQCCVVPPTAQATKLQVIFSYSILDSYIQLMSLETMTGRSYKWDSFAFGSCKRPVWTKPSPPLQRGHEVWSMGEQVHEFDL